MSPCPVVCLFLAIVGYPTCTIPVQNFLKSLLGSCFTAISCRLCSTIGKVILSFRGIRKGRGWDHWEKEGLQLSREVNGLNTYHAEAMRLRKKYGKMPKKERKAAKGTLGKVRKPTANSATVAVLDSHRSSHEKAIAIAGRGHTWRYGSFSIFYKPKGPKKYHIEFDDGRKRKSFNVGGLRTIAKMYLRHEKKLVSEQNIQELVAHIAAVVSKP